MHRTDIDPVYAERIAQMRVSPTHLSRGVAPATTALVVVDLQNGFMRPGALVEVPMAREIVGNVNRIGDALRVAGGKVAFSRYTANLAEPKPWNAFFQRFLDPARAKAQAEVFAPGAPDHALWDGLTVAEGDFVFDKTRYSCLTPGTSPLQGWLEAQAIETVIIVGTLSNCCCESTARDAMQLGFDVIYVTDANATVTDGEHLATLVNMGALFAELADTETLVSALGSAAPMARAG